MSLQEKWERAIGETKILRPRLRSLLAFENTELPYTCLTKSVVNVGDTVVRKGKVVVHKPMIVLPRDLPQFEGFEFERDFDEVDEDEIGRFLLMRGVSFPMLKYSNQTYTVNLFEGPLGKAIGHFSRQLERKEDVHSGLITGPEDSWQFSVLIYVGTLAVRSAPHDIERLLDYLNKHGHW